MRHCPYLVPHPTAHECPLLQLTDQKSFCQSWTFLHPQIWDIPEPKEVTFLEVSFPDGSLPPRGCIPMKVRILSLGLHTNKSPFSKVMRRVAGPGLGHLERLRNLNCGHLYCVITYRIITVICVPYEAIPLTIRSSEIHAESMSSLQNRHTHVKWNRHEEYSFPGHRYKGRF